MKTTTIAKILAISGTLFLIYLMYYTIAQKADMAKKDIEIRELKEREAEYARMVITCLPDSALYTYCKISEEVQLAWLEYSREKMLADEAYQQIDSMQNAIKEATIKKAEQEMGKIEDAVDDNYRKIEETAFKKFTENNPDFQNFICNPNNARNSYAYLGSNNNYWSLTTSFDYSNIGKDTDKKCPEQLKVFVATCKQAKDAGDTVKAEAKKAFEKQSADADDAYMEATMPAFEMTMQKIDMAYKAFLQKIKK